MKKVFLSFVWHMHQPDYFDPEAQEVALPWVRFHGMKGYGDMPRHLARHPGVKGTFNFSGTLLRELATFTPGARRERFVALTLKPAADLAYEEKLFLLKHFFSAAPQRIESIPRYRELLARRGRESSERMLGAAAGRFSAADFSDLQALFNLVWFGRAARERWPRVDALLGKGSGFTQGEKEEIVAVEDAACAGCVDAYRALLAAGQVELSATPFFHPILPLLLDSDNAIQGLPGAALPPRFSFPEDARWHVEEALRAFAAVFGAPPAGMWPAEGSVCQELFTLMDGLGVRWIATDEDVLWKSLRSSLLGATGRERLLYRPYRLAGGECAVFFRDHYLSDRVGFTYQSMGHEAAVEDFVAYLRLLAGRAQGEESPAVTVILDGENAWPYYPDDGEPFLDALYARIEREEWIETTTPSRLLDAECPAGQLSSIRAGSWIDASFRIWIGDHAKNRAWKQLCDAREAVTGAACPPERREAAMGHVRAAQGSDWFWWYGEPNSSTEDPVFDQLFRSRLRAALREVGAEPSVSLLKPPGEGVRPAPVTRSPLAFIHPDVDGEGLRYFEWYNAGKYEVRQRSGAMMGATPLFSTVYYGFDYDFIYLRLDPLATPALGIEARLSDVQVRVVLDEEREKWVAIALPSPPAVTTQGGAADAAAGVKVGFLRTLEVAIPVERFDLKRGAGVRVNILVTKNGILAEKYPDGGCFEIAVPDRAWDDHRWIV